MIRKPSSEWSEYCQKLQNIKKKSNREVLCTECWMMLNYEQRARHNELCPGHTGSILTSSQFASKAQFYQIALRNGKVIKKANGLTLVIQPCLFDLKKGSQHMEMIEEISREMHKEETVDWCWKSHHEIEVQRCNGSRGATKGLTMQDNKHSSKGLSNRVDYLMNNLAEFEVDVTWKLFYYDFAASDRMLSDLCSGWSNPNPGYIKDTSSQSNYWDSTNCSSIQEVPKLFPPFQPEDALFSPFPTWDPKPPQMQIPGLNEVSMNLAYY